MSDEFDFDWLVDRLDGLSPRARVLFSALCAERVLEFYRHFQEQSQWGNVTTLLESLGLAYRFVRVGYVSYDETDHLLSLCDEVVPSTEEFPSLEASLAQFAAHSTMYTLSLIRESLPKYGAFAAYKVIEVIHAVEQLGGTVAAGVQTDALAERRSCDTQREQELQKQSLDLQRLASCRDFDEAFITMCRQENRNYYVCKG